MPEMLADQTTLVSAGRMHAFPWADLSNPNSHIEGDPRGGPQPYDLNSGILSFAPPLQ